MKIVDFVKTGSVEETVSVLNELGHKAIVVAGGTALQFSKSEDEKVAVHIDIDELKKIKEADNHYEIGALVNISDLYEYSGKGWVLGKVAKKFSSQQIRNISTLGGNIAQVFPWSDFPVVLLSLNADIAVSFGDHEKVFTADKFFERQPMHLLNNKLLVTNVKVPVLSKGEGFGYFKEVRTSAAFSTMTTAAYIKLENNKIKDLRVAVGASVGMPVLLTDIEFELKGRNADEETIRKVVAETVKTHTWRGKEGAGDEYAANLAEVRVLDAVIEALKNAKGEVK